MEEDDDIVVLGERNLESFLTKNEQISSCYDDEHQLGLHCDSQWVFDTSTQTRNNNPYSEQPAGYLPGSETTWSDKEKYLLEKGLELFGRSWSRLAQYIETKSANQVKLYVKATGIRWNGTFSNSMCSLIVENMDHSFSELIDDMDIPASVEEVIAVVSTAQPTVVLASSTKDDVNLSSSTTHRKCQRKKRNALTTKRRLRRSAKENAQDTPYIYNVQDIKEALGKNKEHDCIVLPNGEQVVRLRHESIKSGDSDVNIDVDSDSDQACSENIHGTSKEIKYTQSQYSIIKPQVEDDVNGVSVHTETVLQESAKHCTNDNQIFMVDVLTPSGEILTVVVADEMPPNTSSFGIDQCHYNRNTKIKLDARTKDEEMTKFDSVINRHSSSSLTTSELGKRGDRRTPRSHKFKFQGNSVENGGYTMIHKDSGEVVVEYTKSRKRVANSDKAKLTKKTQPVKRIHCKNHSAKNKAPCFVQLEVSALVLMDVHSHMSSKCEVIGLLGGKYTPGQLTITVAVPCRTLVSSNTRQQQTHCDMCPVSQLESSEMVSKQGLSIVGWYHSHPDFAPAPSEIDVDTQHMLQESFKETGLPFVGLIISPWHFTHYVSTYRCCHVMRYKNNGVTPYNLEVKVISHDESETSLNKSIEAAYNTVVQQNRPLQSEIIHKCLESVLHHMKKALLQEKKISCVTSEIRRFFQNHPSQFPANSWDCLQSLPSPQLHTITQAPRCQTRQRTRSLPPPPCPHHDAPSSAPPAPPCHRPH